MPLSGELIPATFIFIILGTPLTFLTPNYKKEEYFIKVETQQ